MPVSMNQPVAVIDIGSNSVRLVIYNGLVRAPISIFNEKVLCGLARNLQQTGHLDEKAVERTHRAIGRFIMLSRKVGVSDIFMFATAAVRDATDGADFVKEVQTQHDVTVNILSGKQEAYYAALGAIATLNEPKGVVGDLGGGSLELTPIKDDKASEGISFPIGPLRLLAEGSIAKADYQDLIDAYISDLPLLEHMNHKTFYPVGGAFRSLAKIHMERKAYPLKVIHNYKIPADEFENTLQIISRMSEGTLRKVPYISSKRMSFMPYAALLASRLLHFGKPKSVVFSAYGVREGILFSKLDAQTQSNDPLIAGCEEIALRTQHSVDYGYALYQWIAPLFAKKSDNEDRLHLAACILSDISCHENAEYRAEMAYRRILDSSLIGINHKERLFIAKAIYCRYSSHRDETILAAMQSLLSEKRFQAAQTLGSAMRLGRSLSCSNAEILAKTSLNIVDNTLFLHLHEEEAVLGGEAIEKRFRQLGNVIGCNTEIII